MPLIETKGAASAQGFGGAGAGASGPVTYIEDVFSTYLYTGNGSTQTITNGIDLAGKGGLVWMKSRSAATTQDHFLMDTARGDNVSLSTNFSLGNDPGLSSYFDFNSSGFGFPTNLNRWNQSGQTYASWTFREQPKFFDVVTYTGDGTSNRAINHSLGAVPGCVIVKKTNAAQNWTVWHRTFTIGDHMYLNTTGAVVNNTVAFGSNANTSTTFNVGAFLNANGDTYVAYLFAHDAGGFGLTGSDNVISCGTFTSTVAAQSINLGWEPQWLMYKRTSGIDSWHIADSMRGFQVDRSGGTVDLEANSTAAESAYGITGPTATGFTHTNGQAGDTYIYIAIRRGPMKVPTSGTSVFAPIASSAASGTKLTTGFPVDMQITAYRSGTASKQVVDRLRGVSTNTTGAGQTLYTNLTSAEAADAGSSLYWDNTGFQMPVNWSGISDVFWNFRRAPGFFDEVCYTGDNQNPTRSIPHNLAAVPELIIHKYRNVSGVNWNVYLQSLGTNAGLILNGSNATITPRNLFGTPSASNFVVKQTSGDTSGMNWTGTTYVAYLFATCAGVSKVGSYTGTGALQTVDCGFTGGARFVLIKRTDSTGDWYVWDSARGIVAGSDPYLTLNTTAAEVTTTDWVDTYSAGFELSNAGGNNVNINGATYIFLSVA